VAIIEHVLRITGLKAAADGLEDVGDAAKSTAPALSMAADGVAAVAAAAGGATPEMQGLAAASADSARSIAGTSAAMAAASDVIGQATAAIGAAGSEVAQVGDNAKLAAPSIEQLAAEFLSVKKATIEQASALGLTVSEYEQVKKAAAAAADAVELTNKNAARAGNTFSTRLANGIDEAGKQAGKLGQGLGVLSPTLGSLAMGVADAADGLLALATPTGAAVAAVVGLSAAAVGGVAAIAGLVVGLGQATLAADEALASLEGFKLIGSDIYPAVPPATLQSIKEANAAVDSLLSIFQLLVVEVGGNVAPAFAKAGKAATGLALSVLEGFRAITEGQSILKSVAVGLVSVLAEPFMAVLRPLAALQDGYAKLAEMAGVEVPAALKNNLERLEMMRVGLAASVVDTLDLSAASSGLGVAYDALAAKGDTFVQQQIRATAAMEANTGAADSQAAALTRLAEAQRDASAALAYDLGLGEQAAKAMEARRAAMEAQAATIQGSFGIGEAIGGAAGQAAAPPTMVQQLGTVGNIAGSLQGGAGGLAGAASQIGTSAGMAAAGPIVAAIMQVMQLVTSLVPEDGAMGLQDQIHGFFMEFFGDLGELPAVLAKGMTDSIREGIPAMFEAIPALVEGLIAAIPELIVATVEQFPLMIGGLVQMLIVGIPKAILNGIGALFSFDLWKGLVDAMIQGFKEMFAPIFGNKETGEKGAFQEGGYFDQVFVGQRERRRGERTILGSRASGDDYIGQTGLYLMHKGETVSGNGRLAPATSGSSGGTSIIIQGSVYGIDDLARAMREATRRGVVFG